MTDSFTFSRMRFTVHADSQLRTLAARTQLRPNVICRMALAYSLNLPQVPTRLDEEEWSGREINRGTLLGDIEMELASLLRQWKSAHKFDYDLNDLCLWHVHRGIESLSRSTAGVRGVETILLRVGGAGQ